MAQSFVKSYYDIFDSDRRALAAIYVSCICCLPCCACLAVPECLHASSPNSGHRPCYYSKAPLQLEVLPSLRSLRYA